MFPAKPLLTSLHPPYRRERGPCCYSVALTVDPWSEGAAPDIFVLQGSVAHMAVSTISLSWVQRLPCSKSASGPLSGPHLGLGTWQTLRRVEGTNEWVNAFQWRAGLGPWHFVDPNIAPTIRNSISKSGPMNVCLFLNTRFLQELTPNFPLKLSGTAQGSREEKQVHKCGSRVDRPLGIYQVSGSGGPELGLGGL